MKKMKRLVVAAMMVLALVAMAATVYAASLYKTPAEVVAGLTGRELPWVVEERVRSGKRYGTIAREAGKLDEFKAEVLEMKKEKINGRVAAGALTREGADKIIQAIEEKQAHCDGTGTGCGVGCRHGAGFGAGEKSGQKGHGYGCGEGGHGIGRRHRDGSCIKHD